MMRGGKEIPMLTPTSAFAGAGMAIDKLRRIVPKSNFFILVPPLCITPHFGRNPFFSPKFHLPAPRQTSDWVDSAHPGKAAAVRAATPARETA